MPRHPKPKRKGRNAFDRGGAISDPDAHDAVEIAMRDGVLVRPEACETCGKTPPPLKNGKCAIQAHHDDYNFPLRVRWLCKSCHFRWHQKNVAIPRRDAAPSALADWPRALDRGVPFDPLGDIAARLRSVHDDAAYLAMVRRQ